MLSRFFRTARRNILRNKVYSLINLLGLSMGIALSILVFIYSKQELSYDQFHSKVDRLYRIRYDFTSQNLSLASTPPPIAPKMANYFPEVEAAVRVFGRNITLKTDVEGSEAVEENAVFFVDSLFDQLFDLQFIHGDPSEALRENTVLITDEMAIKHFGETDVVGRSIQFAGRADFTVVGVIEEFPEASHLHFNMLLPYENMYDMESPQAAQIMRQNLSVNFIISHSYTYVLLHEGADPKNVDAAFPDFMKEHTTENFIVGQVFTLLPISDIHLTEGIQAEPEPPGSLPNIILFIAVGILTLIIASINYVNLATAQSFSRIKEIGVRKTLGSSRRQLISQFLAEALIFVLGAFLLAFLLIVAVLPLFNELTSKQFIFTEILTLELLLLCLGVLLILMLFAGTYPAFYITRFNAVKALKGKNIQATSNGRILRKSLVVFQLTIASVLLAGSLIIYNQLDYMNSKPLGFDKDQVIMLQLNSQNLNNIFNPEDSTFLVRLTSFSNEMKNQAFAESTSRISGALGVGAVYRGVVPEGFTTDDNMFNATLGIDFDFFETFGVQMEAGRTFSRDFGSDPTTAFIVNESAVKEYEWGTPEEAIGKEFNLEGKVGKVVGVVKDFHFSGLTTVIGPLVIHIAQQAQPILAVKVAGDNVENALESMQSRWNELFPEKAFEYNLLDEILTRQYQTYIDFGKIIRYFTFIAIIIACLGLYGMILHSAHSRIKEIGIKKVLGASVSSLLFQMLKDFYLLLIIAFFIAVPLAYYLGNEWLAEFEYRIIIGASVFTIGLLAIFVIVTTTVVYNAWKAATINPVDSIRNE